MMDPLGKVKFMIQLKWNILASNVITALMRQICCSKLPSPVKYMIFFISSASACFQFDARQGAGAESAAGEDFSPGALQHLCIHYHCKTAQGTENTAQGKKKKMQTYVFWEDLQRKEKGREKKNLLFLRYLYFFLSHEKNSD